MGINVCAAIAAVAADETNVVFLLIMTTRKRSSVMLFGRRVSIVLRHYNFHILFCFESSFDVEKFHWKIWREGWVGR